jgi:hypothetical protein
MPLYTFFIEYRGGTYISQVRARSSPLATKAWAGKFLEMKVLRDPPTALDGLKKHLVFFSSSAWSPGADSLHQNRRLGSYFSAACLSQLVPVVHLVTTTSCAWCAKQRHADRWFNILYFSLGSLLMLLLYIGADLTGYAWH